MHFLTLKELSRRRATLAIVLSAICLTGETPTIAQSADVSAEYRRGLQTLLAQCPAEPTDYAQALEECALVGPEMTNHRSSFPAQVSRWADDKLSQYQFYLDARMFGHLMVKDNKRLGPSACQHAEAAWLSLHQISVEFRRDDEFFFKVRPSIHPVISKCRNAFGEPDWGAPLVLGEPLPK